jgi:hypothetical protein
MDGPDSRERWLEREGTSEAAVQCGLCLVSTFLLQGICVIQNSYTQCHTEVFALLNSKRYVKKEAVLILCKVRSLHNFF